MYDDIVTYSLQRVRTDVAAERVPENVQVETRSSVITLRFYLRVILVPIVVVRDGGAAVCDAWTARGGCRQWLVAGAEAVPRVRHVDDLIVVTPLLVQAGKPVAMRAILRCCIGMYTR